MPPDTCANTRNVLITGCSSGIGRHLAQGLAQRGYRVFATARQAKDVESLRGLGLEAAVLDLADSASIRQGSEWALETGGGRLYALINNGAYGQPGAVEDLSRDTLRRQFETNVFGTQELTNRLLPVFRRQGAGRIVYISSILGLVCLPYRGAYNATKFAMEALADTLRLELAGTGVRVSLVEPGPIRSRFRVNALAAFVANIDAEHSVHRDTYAAVKARLFSKGDAPFTRGPEAVLGAVVRALESPRPRARYPVTFPTRLFAVLRRVLPTAWLDRVARGAGGGGKR